LAIDGSSNANPNEIFINMEKQPVFNVAYALPMDCDANLAALPGSGRLPCLT